MIYPSRFLSNIEYQIQSSKQTSSLIDAVRRGDRDAVKRLLSKRQEVNAKDDEGRTALMHATLGGDVSIVELLLEHGADVNGQDDVGTTALMEAVRLGAEDIVVVLMDAGAELDLQNKSGKTALMLAVSKGIPDIVELLLEGSADIDLRDLAGDTALVYAVSEKPEAADIVALLIEHGADLDLLYEASSSILFSAVTLGDLDILEQLLEGEANVNTQNEDGTTPLILAVLLGRVDIVEILLEAGAKMYVKENNQWSAPLFAKYCLNEEAYKKVKELFKKKAKDEHIEDFRTAYSIIKMGHILHRSGTVDYEIAGKTHSIGVEGVMGNHLSRVMLKGLQRFQLEQPQLFLEKEKKILEEVLKFHGDAYHSSAERCLEEYLKKKALLVSTGYLGHRVYVLFWNEMMVLVNRGACSRRGVEIFRIQGEQDQRHQFVQDTINKCRHMDVYGEKKEYEEWLNTLGDPLMYKKATWVDEELEKRLSLPPQTTGNCSWANLEGALFVLMSLHAIGAEKLLVAPEERCERYFKDISFDFIGARAKLRDYFEHHREYVEEKYNNIVKKGAV